MTDSKSQAIPTTSDQGVKQGTLEVSADKFSAVDLMPDRLDGGAELGQAKVSADEVSEIEGELGGPDYGMELRVFPEDDGTAPDSPLLDDTHTKHELPVDSEDESQQLGTGFQDE